MSDNKNNIFYIGGQRYEIPKVVADIIDQKEARLNNQVKRLYAELEQYRWIPVEDLSRLDRWKENPHISSDIELLIGPDCATGFYNFLSCEWRWFKPNDEDSYICKPSHWRMKRPLPPQEAK